MSLSSWLSSCVSSCASSCASSGRRIAALALALTLPTSVVACRETRKAGADAGGARVAAPDGGGAMLESLVGALGRGGAVRGLLLELPAVAPPGVPLPVIVRTADGSTASAALDVEAAGERIAGVELRRGRGAFRIVARRAGPLVVEVRAGHARAMTTITIAAAAPRTLQGVLGDDDLRWSPDAPVRLGADVTVPPGRTLVVEPGTIVLAAGRANLIVEGALDARGAAGRAVLFAPEAPGAAWGGIHLAPGSRATLRQTLVTGAGGDDARAYGHSSSQPVVFADGAALDWEGGGAIDNPGKGPSSRRAEVTLRDLVVARCDQGGEHSGSTLLIDRSHYLELPDADGRLEDDDNDGLHLDPGGRPPAEAPMRIRDSVFAITEDDGIDHNGVVLDVERVWIEGAAHEGIAGSAGGRLTITDAIVTRCKQGIEAGWGAPEVVVAHALVAGNEVGLRWGDEYEMENAGTLRATNVVSVGNRRANVLSLWEGGGNVARPEAIEIACSRVDTPGWDGRAGNEGGLPPGAALFDATGCVAPTHRTRAACPAAPLGPRGCP